MIRSIAFFFILAVSVSACRSVARFTSSETKPAMPKKESAPVATAPAEYSEEGLATYYAADFHGRKTSNGEIFDMKKLSAAHVSLPFGTVVRVTNLSNNKSITVRINDRMPPNNKGRIIDLSLAAAREIELVAQGVAKVRVEVISK